MVVFTPPMFTPPPMFKPPIVMIPPTSVFDEFNNQRNRLRNRLQRLKQPIISFKQRDLTADLLLRVSGPPMPFALSKIGACFEVPVAETKEEDYLPYGAVREDISGISSEALASGITIATGLAIAMGGGSSAGIALVMCGCMKFYFRR